MKYIIIKYPEKGETQAYGPFESHELARYFVMTRNGFEDEGTDWEIVPLKGV